MEDGGEARLTESEAGSGSSITPVDSGTATAEPVTTVHYISPASTASGRSEREGDFVDYYWPFYARDGAERRPVEGPDSSSSSSVASCAEHGLQRTLAIVKPEAFQFRDVVLRAVRESSLKIVNERVVRLTPEQVSEVYEKYYGTPAFPHLVVSASLSPVLVLSLQGIGAVDEWERVIGPRGPLRAEWFLPAAPDPRTARRENRYFFPRDVLEPLPREPRTVGDYVSTRVGPILLEGLTEIVRAKPLDPVVALAEWLLLHNPNRPKYPYSVAMVPT